MESFDPPSPRRSSMLTVLLTGMIAVFTGLFFIVITGGWVVYLFQAVCFIGFLCFCHYFLWGRLLDEQVAGEREEEQLRQRAMEVDREE